TRNRAAAGIGRGALQIRSCALVQRVERERDNRAPGKCSARSRRWRDPCLPRNGIARDCDWNGARVSLQGAIALLPPMPATYIDLGIVYLRTGDLDKALGQFETGL